MNTTSELNSATRAACFRLLRPVIRILLRFGVSWKEFAEIAKVVFVDVARQEYGVHGRPTNASRVAMMSGLSRREVGEIRKRLDAEDEPLDIEPKSKLARVLTGWYTDPEFARGGEPAVLAEADFLTLAHRYAGDIPDQAITKEMLSLGLMERADGGYRVTRREYVGDPADPDIVRQMGEALHNHGVAVAHNLDPDRGDAWFERFAANDRMPAGSAARLNELLKHDGQSFLEKMDAWLTEHEMDGDAAKNAHRVGVGIYLFEYPNDES
jgi:hypothetical protein